MPVRHEVANGISQLNAVVLDIDEKTGQARGIIPVQKFTS
jgi:hypothetical protein